MKSVRIGNRNLDIVGISDTDIYYANVVDGMEEPFQRFCAIYLREDDVVLDIGANIGITACILAQRVTRGHVHAFEPSKTVFSALARNIEGNGLSNVTVHNAAVSSAPGTAFFEDNSAWGHLSLSQQGSHQIRVTTIDDIVDELKLDRLDFIKIDVEGNEWSVLKGAAKTIARFNPVIYLEFNSWVQIEYSKINPLEFAEWIFANFKSVNQVADDRPDLLKPLTDPRLTAHDNIVLHHSMEDLVVCMNATRLEESQRALPERSDAELQRQFQAKSTHQVRILRVGGQSIPIAGLASDAYFTGIDKTSAANIPLYQLIWEEIPANSVIFDVGANIGLISTIFRRVVRDAVVYSFEPGPTAYGCLKETLRLNDLDTTRAFNIGLGEKAGRLRFNQNTMLSGSHIVTDDHPNPAIANIAIDVVTIDDFVGRQDIRRLDFIKIDVEGFELEVLKGAKKTIQRFKPRVFAEFNSYSLISARNVNPRQTLDELLAIFPNVSWHDGRNWNRIRTKEDKHTFIYANLVLHHCVSDLLLSF